MAGNLDDQLFESINFSEVLSHWEKVGATKDVTVCKEDGSFQEYACRAMGLPMENIKELEEICSMARLDFEDEVYDGHCPLVNLPQAVNLATVHHRKGIEEKMKEQVFRSTFRKQLKYKFMNQPALHGILNQKSAQAEEQARVKLMEEPEIIINVRVYVPQYRGVRGALRIGQEFQVLGSQFLTELRDVIHCEADNMGALERSSQADLVVNLKAKDLYKSGFFYIGTTFYNDFRGVNAKDCSETVISWLTENGSSTEYKKADMATTRFNELTVRMGYPYLYGHQGNCEHLLTFTDITLMNPATVSDVSKYPVLMGRLRFRSQKCRACVNAQAVWLVRNSDYTPEDPCYMCETCFRMLHYAKDGKKIGNFCAYSINPETNEAKS